MKTCGQAGSMVFAVLVAGFLCAFDSSAVAERVQDLPRPTDYVNDNAHVLSSGAVAELDRICSELDHSQANTQVAILTVHSLDGDDPADYANQVEELWRIGKKGSDRGVLVLLAVDDRRYRIDVGYGLEGILPDGKLGDIGREMVPYLRARDFDDAIELAVGQVAQVVSADAKITLNNAPAAPKPPGTIFSTGQIIFVCFVLLLFVGPVLLRIGYELGRLIGLWKGPFPWAPRGIGGSSLSGAGESGGEPGGGNSDSGSAGSDPCGGGDFGGGGAGGSW